MGSLAVRREILNQHRAEKGTRGRRGKRGGKRMVPENITTDDSHPLEPSFAPSGSSDKDNYMDDEEEFFDARDDYVTTGDGMPGDHGYGDAFH